MALLSVAVSLSASLLCNCWTHNQLSCLPTNSVRTKSKERKKLKKWRQGCSEIMPCSSSSKQGESAVAFLRLGVIFLCSPFLFCSCIYAWTLQQISGPVRRGVDWFFVDRLFILVIFTHRCHRHLFFRKVTQSNCNPSVLLATTPHTLSRLSSVRSHLAVAVEAATQLSTWTVNAKSASTRWDTALAPLSYPPFLGKRIAAASHSLPSSSGVSAYKTIFTTSA